MGFLMSVARARPPSGRSLDVMAEMRGSIDSRRATTGRPVTGVEADLGRKGAKDAKGGV